MKHRLQNRLQVTTDDFLGAAIGDSWDGPRIRHLMQFVLGMKDEDDLSLPPTYGGVGHHRH
jgi:hypothetical protein